MANLSQYQRKAVPLTLTGKDGREYTYQLTPPTSERATQLIVLLSIGSAAALSAGTPCPTCGRNRDFEMPDEWKTTLEDVKGMPVGELAMGGEVWAAMDADGIPGMDKDMAGLWAAFMWTYGENQANAFIETTYAELGSAGETGPKARKP